MNLYSLLWACVVETAGRLYCNCIQGTLQAVVKLWYPAADVADATTDVADASAVDASAAVDDATTRDY